MSITQAMDDVLEAFRGCSVNGVALHATSDPDRIVTPCVYVPIPSLTFRFSKRCLDAEWEGYLIAGQSGGVKANDPILSNMIDAVTGLFTFIDGQPYSMTLPGAVAGLPAQAYRLTWATTIPIGD